MSLKTKWLLKMSTIKRSSENFASKSRVPFWSVSANFKQYFKASSIIKFWIQIVTNIQQKTHVLGSKMQPGSCWAPLGHSCRPDDMIWHVASSKTQKTCRMSKLSTVFLDSEGVRTVRIASDVSCNHQSIFNIKKISINWTKINALYVYVIQKCVNNKEIQQYCICLDTFCIDWYMYAPFCVDL